MHDWVAKIVGVVLIRLSGTFAICRLGPEAPVPEWAEGPLVSVTRTPAELSVVCRDGAVPAGIRAERGWRCLEVEGPLDLGTTGVLASLAEPLAARQIPLFAVSTFDTDYLLVRDVAAAVEALREAGHTVR